MTREEKIKWLENATNEEVVDQMRWAVAKTGPDMSFEMRIEGEEDYNLITAEILKRMK